MHATSGPWESLTTLWDQEKDLLFPFDVRPLCSQASHAGGPADDGLVATVTSSLIGKIPLWECFLIGWFLYYKELVCHWPLVILAAFPYWLVSIDVL